MKMRKYFITKRDRIGQRSNNFRMYNEMVFQWTLLTQQYYCDKHEISFSECFTVMSVGQKWFHYAVAMKNLAIFLNMRFLRNVRESWEYAIFFSFFLKLFICWIEQIHKSKTYNFRTWGCPNTLCWSLGSFQSIANDNNN